MTTFSIHQSQASSWLSWTLLGVVLFVWGVAIVQMAQLGLLRQTPGLPPLLTIASVLLPVLVGVLLWKLSPSLRSWTETWDLSTLVALQTFRTMGIVFAFVWWLGVLPTLFAWAAALGDVAVGILAIPVTLAVARQSPGWQARVRKLTFFGIADFVMVLTLATLSQQDRILHFAGEPTPAAMQEMPMAMIPSFLVPIFILLLLLQWQRAQA